MTHQLLRLFTALVATFLLVTVPLAQAQLPTDEHWVGTWATAVVAQPATGGGGFGAGPPVFANQTVRQIVRVSLGGPRVRVVLSNTYGTLPLSIGAVQLARRADEASLVEGSNRDVTFGGRGAVTIPAGAAVTSDPVTLAVPELSDIVVDLYIPGDTAALGSPLTTHTGALQTGYVSTPGDHTGVTTLPVETTIASWYFLSRVDVAAADDAGAVVLLGDSITDGTGSSLDTNNRWPDHLARRLHDAGRPMGVMNLGIGGNRVLSDGLGVNALARFDRDVLAQAGVTHVVVLEGINDVGLALNELGLPRSDPPPAADDIIFGHHQLVTRAKTHGLRILGGTLLPFEGTTLAILPNYWTAAGDETRQAVNEWIRSSGTYDGVIDFDAVLRDPDAPGRMLPLFDSGDGLHPGDAGYAAMAEAVDLELLATVSDAP